MEVVSAFSRPGRGVGRGEDSLNGRRVTTRYRYHEGHFDGHRREFDGFGRSEQIEVGDASMPTAVTVFNFHTDASARALVPDPELRRTLKRKLYRVEVFGKDGSSAEDRAYRIEESEWAVRIEETGVDGRRVLFPHIVEFSVHTFERGTTARIERRSYTYDSFGNVLTEERRGAGGAEADLFLQTAIEYALNLENWVVDRPALIVQRDESGTLQSETRHYYDGPAFEGLALGDVTKGLCSRIEKAVLPQTTAASVYGTNLPDFVAIGYHAGNDADGQLTWNIDDERCQLDARGNVVARMDPRGHSTLYDFDTFESSSTALRIRKVLRVSSSTTTVPAKYAGW